MTAPVKPTVFEAMQNVDIDRLSKFTESELRCVLPGIVRMALCSPLDLSDRGVKLRKSTLIILSGLEVVNNIVGLLSIDFNALETDVRKEIQLRYVHVLQVKLAHSYKKIIEFNNLISLLLFYFIYIFIYFETKTICLF
jgi:hypothetical protein